MHSKHTWKKLASYKAKKKYLCKKLGVKEEREGLLKACGTYSTCRVHERCIAERLGNRVVVEA